MFTTKVKEPEIYLTSSTSGSSCGTVNGMIDRYAMAGLQGNPIVLLFNWSSLSKFIQCVQRYLLLLHWWCIKSLKNWNWVAVRFSSSAVAHLILVLCLERCLFSGSPRTLAIPLSNGAVALGHIAHQLLQGQQHTQEMICAVVLQTRWGYVLSIWSVSFWEIIKRQSQGQGRGQIHAFEDVICMGFKRCWTQYQIMPVSYGLTPSASGC